AAEAATRVPSGHPEGYLEAFAQLYRDAAAQMHAIDAGRAVPELTRGMPDVDDGVAGLKFMDAAMESSRQGSCWIGIAP
ncbi:MAG TPA: gfo/Idh/MocA family oxidoreductase, partial [Duganella sp.]|nr:gfo/Idh/MocA family oxidoreductase [Duganella sp.]